MVKVKNCFWCFLVIFSTVVMVSPTQAEDQLKITWSDQINSEYINVVGKKLHNGPVNTSTLDFSLDNGWGFTIWHSMGLNDADLSSDKGDEVDLTLRYKEQLGNDRYLTLGVVYVNMVDLLSTESDNVRPFAELGQEWSAGSHKITVYARVEYKQPITGLDNGAWVFGGVKDVWQPNPGLMVNFHLYLVWDDTSHEGLLLMGIFNPSWRVTKELSLNAPFLKGSVPLIKATDRESELVLGGGITRRF